MLIKKTKFHEYKISNYKQFFVILLHCISHVYPNCISHYILYITVYSLVIYIFDTNIYMY